MSTEVNVETARRERRPAPVPQRSAPRVSRLSSRWREILAGEAFLIPIALVFIVLIMVPFGSSVYYSFTDFNGFDPTVKWVGLKNYASVFTDASLLSGLGFTVLYAVGTTVIITCLAIPLAVILNQRFFGRRFVRSIFFFPAIPSIAILGLVWNFILSPLGSGALNAVLGNLFGIGPIPWLANATLAQFCTILVGVWTSVGWHAILYLAYLQSIPTDYYEVATIDGANGRQRFFGITLPLLMPAVTVSTLLLMTSGLNVYALPATLTNGGPGYATHTITQSIILSGISSGQYGLASALGVVFMIAVGVIVLIQFRVSQRFEANAS